MNGVTGHETAPAADGAVRAGFLIDLIDIEVFFETHDAALVPELRTLSYRMPSGATDAERHARVDEVAAMLGVHAEWRDGTYRAEREFGSIKVEAHYTPTVVTEAFWNAVRDGKAAA